MVNHPPQTAQDVDREPGSMGFGSGFWHSQRFMCIGV